MGLKREGHTPKHLVMVSEQCLKSAALVLELSENICVE